MPQNGFHGLVGLAAAKRLGERVPAGFLEDFAGGIVVGAMLPDVDLYPAALVYLIGHADWIDAVHRTFTHSLLALLIVAAAARYFARSDPHRAWLLRGLLMGMVTHETLDVFFWFSPIDLFWPLSHLPVSAPLLPVVNLWKGFHYPQVLGNPDFIPNLLASFDFAAFGLYLGALKRIAARHTPTAPLPPGFDSRERLLWAAFGLSVPGAVLFSGMVQQVLVSTPLLLLFLPYCWKVTTVLVRPISRWCGGRRF